MYPAIEPYETGMLDVGAGNQVYWEVSGNPAGRPALVVHGGPGSGSSPHRRCYHDPEAYRIVQFDQRGTGRSTPDAGLPDTDLSVNTTDHLIADMERLREHLGIDRWQLAGVSWGSTLSLAYAQRHPERVTEMILFAVTAGRPGEIEWITRTMGRIFPREWERFRDAVPEQDRDGNLAAAYARLLADPRTRDQAARDWCAWEDTHVSLAPGHRPDPRYEDPAFRMRFARLVTHYWGNDCFLPPGTDLVRDAGVLRGIPGVLIHGRFDVSSPLATPWELHRSWPDSRLVVIDEGHGGATMSAEVVTATDRFRDRDR
ncbi:proline iminopeptidase [Sphaerisporangium rufum]|uniref:Proline iminopeptidase n=1 Tax=Sphaerisporangium rufum TaxID=1381558 RepID=A0A919R1Q4_9ACTN|nr:prolyl aminopeptidase [Sphaerisporangium rufum]GII78129.1 proline iminopeptidase [Sphaerisporangium rufum]